MHYACNYIGVKWVLNGDGSESSKGGFDCWGLFREVQNKYYNKNVPALVLPTKGIHIVLKEFQTNAECHNWYSTDTPVDGDAVLMSISKYPTHIGTWIDMGEIKGILHTTEETGVIFTTIYNLKRGGWRINGYYRHKHT